MKVIPEARRAHTIRYLRFISTNISFMSDRSIQNIYSKSR